MTYYRTKDDLKDIWLHLRNKNIAVLPRAVKFLDRILSFLSENISRLNMKRMLRNGYKVVVSEQIIGNPLVFKHLRETDETILDFGGFESLLPLQLSALGYKVTVLDQRKYPFCHPNISCPMP